MPVTRNIGYDTENEPRTALKEHAPVTLLVTLQTHRVFCPALATYKLSCLWAVLESRRNGIALALQDTPDRLMGDYTVVADAGQSMINVLWEEIQADTQVNTLISSESAISLESPADLANDNSVRVSIYLYRIVEDAYMKNQFVSVPGAGGSQRKPPLMLDLYYLVTPMVGAPRDQQIVLGKVMQVLYDRAILEGPDLSGTLAATNQQLRVVLNPVSLEETTRVWQALEVPYRLSVCYLARVAMVDSTTEQFSQPVLAKVDTMQRN